MIFGIIMIVVGITSIVASWVIVNDLKKEKFYERDRLFYPDFTKPGPGLMIHALIAPYAYFKNHKAIEGWKQLMLAAFFSFTELVLVTQGARIMG